MKERKNMMTKRIVRFLIVIGILSLLTTFTGLTMSTLSSEEVHAQGDCTLNTLYGTYLFEARGVITEAGAVHPYAEAGTWTLDGNGNAEGVISIAVEGAPLTRQETFSATYDHVSDCVFTARDAFGLEFDLYTTPSATTVTYFSPGFSGTMFKR